MCHKVVIHMDHAERVWNLLVLLFIYIICGFLRLGGRGGRDHWYLLPKLIRGVVTSNPRAPKLE